MQKIYKAILVIICLMFLSCYSGDDDSNRFIALSIEDALVFENRENYVVGDTVFIGLNFSRYLPEEGFTNLLDIYQSSGSETFYYNYGLSRFSELSNGFQSVAIDPVFLVVEKGTIGDFRGNGAVLNTDQTLYESRVGLVLAEEGRFRFDFDFLNIFSDTFSPDHVQIEIRNRFSGTPPNFEFVVAEQ